MKLFVNLFCTDIEQQLFFYQSLLGLPEAVHSRSAIYRALQGPGFQFGFHAPAAYELLALTDRMPAPHSPAVVSAYATFMMDTHAELEAAVARVPQLGGHVIKAPYATYYHQWQAVLSDPQGHVFRLSVEGLPPGVNAPQPPVTH